MDKQKKVILQVLNDFLPKYEVISFEEEDIDMLADAINDALNTRK